MQQRGLRQASEETRSGQQKRHQRLCVRIEPLLILLLLQLLLRHLLLQLSRNVWLQGRQSLLQKQQQRR